MWILAEVILVLPMNGSCTSYYGTYVEPNFPIHPKDRKLSADHGIVEETGGRSVGAGAGMMRTKLAHGNGRANDGTHDQACPKVRM